VAKYKRSKGQKQQRRRYGAAKREEVLADVRRLGVGGAADKHGVPPSCVSRWWSAGRQEEKTGPTAASGRERAGGDEASERALVVRRPVAARPWSSPSKKQRRVAKAYTPSERAQVLEYAAAHSVTEASEKFGMSRFSIYDWQRKARKAAVGQGPSPTSGPAPSEVEAQRDREILNEWHHHPGLGPSQIKNQLRRKNVKVSVHTVRQVMEAEGYRPPKVKREPHDDRYESVRPNQLWHLDFVHRHINRANTFTLILIDDYSRFVVGHGVDDAERSEMVIQSFEEAVARHGRPEMVMHDKGSAFWSWRGISRFTELLTELGIDQMVAEHKEWNGKIEVFNGNLHKEFFDTQRCHDIGEMRRRLTTHLDWYNHGRTHHALGGLLVPADRYYGRVEQVLARIEAGAGREIGDGAELRDRCLEFFKVTSRAGVAEVWLLGQKLFGVGAAEGNGAVPVRPTSRG
jgi:putative transposase